MKKSIYKYAAEAGVPIGVYLIVMSSCFLMSLKVAVLPMFLLPLALGFPVALWLVMRRIVKEEPSYRKVSVLWLGGIYSVIFGTLICTLFSGLYVTFVEPGFVHAYVEYAIDSIESSPMSAQYAPTTSLMREAMSAHILPSGLEFVSTMAWFTCFAGSVISFLISVVMVRTGKKDTLQMWRN